jgi:hypothetical protein
VNNLVLTKHGNIYVHVHAYVFVFFQWNCNYKWNWDYKWSFTLLLKAQVLSDSLFTLIWLCGFLQVRVKFIWHQEVMTHMHILETQVHACVLLKLDTIDQVPFPCAFIENLERFVALLEIEVELIVPRGHDLCVYK